MPGSSKRSDSGLEHLDWINDQLTVLAEAFGERLTEERQEIYCAGLADIPQDRLDVSFRRARYELKWFPKLAELRELAGLVSGTPDDGRPGPEEAWGRMPKGPRMEDESVVWCEEERAAYDACRGLLMAGDLIGARMAFKERYEKDLAGSRAEGRPVHWTMSAGYDMENRLVALATAVQGKRLSLEAALNFVPGERQDEFAQMLPPKEAKGLLTGNTQKLPDLPGLAGVLAKMQMEGIAPKVLAEEPCSPYKTPADRSPEECRQLREKLNAQLEFLKRSRSGSGAA